VQLSETLLKPVKLGALAAVRALGCSLVSLVINPALPLPHHSEKHFQTSESSKSLGACRV